MKRIFLSLILASFAFVLSAQESIKVNFKGAQPNISDFVTAYLANYEYDEDGDDVLDESLMAMKEVWFTHLAGQSLSKNETLIVDAKNGYVSLEIRDEDGSKLCYQMCYWNESDKRHKLFAYNVSNFRNGKYSPGQFDGLVFYRYDSTTKKMKDCDAPGFDVQYGTDDGAEVNYELPRYGKDIIMNAWYKNKTQKSTLKWDGRKFRKI